MDNEQPVCQFCGEKATCYGKYADHDEGYACDECCGHGCEDGYCEPVRLKVEVVKDG